MSNSQAEDGATSESTEAQSRFRSLLFLTDSPAVPNLLTADTEPVCYSNRVSVCGCRAVRPSPEFSFFYSIEYIRAKSVLISKPEDNIL